MSKEHALNFDYWKTFSKNYKTMRIWLWLVYKLTQNYYRLQLLCQFIQTKERYPTSLDKICILTQKLLVISSKKILCELTSYRAYSLQNISYLSLRLLFWIAFNFVWIYFLERIISHCFMFLNISDTKYDQSGNAN